MTLRSTLPAFAAALAMALALAVPPAFATDAAPKPDTIKNWKLPKKRPRVAVGATSLT